MPPQQLGALSPLGWFVGGFSGSDTDPELSLPSQKLLKLYKSQLYLEAAA